MARVLLVMLECVQLDTIWLYMEWMPVPKGTQMEARYENTPLQLAYNLSSLMVGIVNENCNDS